MMSSKRARAAPRCICAYHFPFFLPPALPLPRLSPHRASPTRICTFTRRILSPPPRPNLLPHRPNAPTRPYHPPMAALSSTPNLSDVDERVLRAVDTLSRQDRLTIPDVAAAAGVPLSLAQDEVVTLAALTGAAIDVTDAGTLAYRFPRDVRARLRAASLRATFRMAWARAFPVLFTAVRVTFGALLILSIVVTFVALAALASASRSDDDRRDSRSTGFMPARVFAPDVFDVMFYTRRRRFYAPIPADMDKPDRREGEMSFLESVYSFVFGDGDPNEGLDERRWRRVAAVIRANRGAVTAEQLAPFLDLPPRPASSTVVDEAFVLPALLRFQGHPEVTEDGDIIYVFPSFSVTGAQVPTVELAGRGPSALDGAGPALVEKELSLSRAPLGQRALVVALGLVNVLGVLTLGAKLASVTPLTSDAAALVGFVRAVYPALAAYAASFVVIPLARFLRQRRVNDEIRARNSARAAASVAVARPVPELRRKITAAGNYAQNASVVKSSDVVYSSDKDVLDQRSVQENLTDDFDRRLNG